MSTSTIVITGARAGIGRAGAMAFGRLGWRVLAHGRDEAKARALCAELAAELGVESGAASTGASFVPIWGDLADFEQVRSLADQIKAVVQHIDVLWNNAGIMATVPRGTSQGFESQWAINHLAPFLLSYELLPLLQASKDCRVIFTSSFAHRWGKLPGIQGFKIPEKYSGFSTYGSTKLANILTAAALRPLLAASGGTAFAYHPGYIATDIGSGGRPNTGNRNPFLRLFMASVEEGADTAVFLATAKRDELGTRLYWSRRKPRPMNRLVDDGNAQALWNQSLEALK